MELHQLRAFVAVAEEGSFTRAAQRLHVVQSAVSATIRTFEAELGAQLFERSTRRVALSDAGLALLPEARNVLAAADLALDAVHQVGSGLRGSVALGVMQAPGMRAVDIAGILARFHADHPLVTLNVRHAGGSQEAADHVREGRLDLAFVAWPDRTAPGLALTLLTTETMVLACSAEHALATRRGVELADLMSEPFAELPVGWGTRMATDRAFAAAGVARDIAFELNDTSTLVEFVRVGLAVAVLPPSMVSGPGIALVSIRRAAPTFTTFLARPGERRSTTAAAALADLITQEAGT